MKWRGRWKTTNWTEMRYVSKDWEERNQGSALADEEKNYWPVVMGLLCLACHVEWVGRSAFLKCVINFALSLWRPHGEKEKCLRGLLRLLHPSWCVSIETHTHNNTNTHTEHITNHTKPRTINFPCDKHEVTNIHQSIIFNQLQCNATLSVISLSALSFSPVSVYHTCAHSQQNPPERRPVI